MITKEKMRVFDHAGNATIVDVTILESEADYALLEERVEPVITVTCDSGAWIVYGDENADHKDFDEQHWPKVWAGGGEMYKEFAKDYAKAWAKAVRGVWEEV
jgi:hypothetical protein